MVGNSTASRAGGEGTGGRGRGGGAAAAAAAGGGGGGGGGGESVRVIVRLRPEEERNNCASDGKGLAGSCVISVEDQKLTVVDPSPPTSSGGKTGGSGATKNEDGKQAHAFSFDRVFGPLATQEEVFDTVKPLVHATVDGFTTTAFAYGSTGSGKTHTISGTAEEPGVLPRAVDLLFERLQSDAAAGSDKAFMVFLTYVEIYNNIFHNLLEGANDSGGVATTAAGKQEHTKASRLSADSNHHQASLPLPPPSTKIEVREHPSRGVFLSGGKGLRVPVSSAAAVANLVSRGTKARRTAATGLNDRSSRSHAILIVEIEATYSSMGAGASMSPVRSTDVAVGTDSSISTGANVGVSNGVDGAGGGPRGRRRGRRASLVDCVHSIGKMQVIDLAGSERVAMSGVEGSSLVEAQSINLSLTLLGDVLSALSKYHRTVARSQGGGSSPAGRGGGGPDGDRPFVPYRNSKLTYLLKDSLGGNCKTLMICAVRTAPACFQQTMMSLRYAGRARDIKNVPHRVLEGAGGSREGLGGASLRGTVGEIERLRSQLVETTAEFERLRGAATSGESEKEELRQQLNALAEKNRSEKHRMDELLEGVIHSQRGELERRKAEFVDLQDNMDSHADTIEKQKETIRDLQTEREAASSAASTAREQVQELRQALDRAEQVSAQFREEASSLRASGELLRIERDRAMSQVSRLENDRKTRQAEDEKGEIVRKTDAEMDTYRKAVKKMAKEREGLKAVAREAQDRHTEAMTALEAKKKEVEVLASRWEETSTRAEDGARDARVARDLSAKLSRELAGARDGASRKAEEEAEVAAINEQTRIEAERQRDLARAEATELMETTRRYREERDRARQSVAVSAAASAAASASLEAEKDRADRAQVVVATLRGELAAAEVERCALKERFDTLKKQKAEAELGRKLLETRKSEVETALAAETAMRSTAEKRDASSVAEVETLRKSLTEASSGWAAATDGVRRLSTDQRTAVEKLECATGTVAFLESSAVALKEELAAVRGERGSLEMKLREAKAGNEALTRCVADKGADIDALKSKITLQNTEAARLKEEVRTVEARAEGVLRRALEAHENEMIAMRNSLQLSKADAEGMKERLEFQEKEGARVRESVNGKLAEAEKLREIVELQKREAEEMSERLQALTAEAQDMRECLELRTEEADATRERLEDENIAVMEKLRQALEAERQTKETLMQEQLGLQNNAEAEKKSLREALELRHKEADETREGLILRHTQEMDTLRGVHKHEAEEMSERLQALTAEAQGMRECLELRTEEASATRERLEEENIAVMEKLRQALEDERQTKETHLQEQLDLRNNAEAEKKDLREALELRQKEANETREGLIFRHTQEMDKLRGVHKHEAEEMSERLQALTAEEQRIRECLELRTEEANATRDRLERENIAVKEKLHQALKDQRQTKETHVQEQLNLENNAKAEKKSLREALELRQKETDETREGLIFRHTQEMDTLRGMHKLETEEMSERLQALTAEAQGMRECLDLRTEEANATRERLEGENIEVMEKLRQALEVEQQTKEIHEQEQLDLRNNAEAETKSLRKALELRQKEATETREELNMRHTMEANALRGEVESLGKEMAELRERRELQNARFKERAQGALELEKQEPKKILEALESHRRETERNFRESSELHKKEIDSVRQRLEGDNRETEAKLRQALEMHNVQAETTKTLKEELELAKNSAEERNNELQERLGVKDGEATDMDRQLRVLGRQVHHLEAASEEREKAYRKEAEEFQKELSLVEMRATVAEEGLAIAEIARVEVLAAAKEAAVAASKEAALVSHQEAEAVIAHTRKDLASSRAEVENIKSQAVGTETRIADAMQEVETMRDGISKEREGWRNTEEEKNERLRQLEEEVELAKAEALEHRSILSTATAERRNVEAEQEKAFEREAALKGRVTVLEGIAASLRQDLEDAVEERDEAQSLGQKRGEGLGQRLLSLGAELRSEKALTAALKASSETAKLDVEDREAEITSLTARVLALEEDRNTLETELPRLRDKEVQCQQLSDGKREAENRLQEEAARGRCLEREVGRLKETLRQSIATVRRHITLSNPHSPAALLAADPAVYSAILGLDGQNKCGDSTPTISGTIDASHAICGHGENGTARENTGAIKHAKGGNGAPSTLDDASSMTFVYQPRTVVGTRRSTLVDTTKEEETPSPSSAANDCAPDGASTVTAVPQGDQEPAVMMPPTAPGFAQSSGDDTLIALQQRIESMTRAHAGGGPAPHGGQDSGVVVLEETIEDEKKKMVVHACLPTRHADDG